MQFDKDLFSSRLFAVFSLTNPIKVKGVCKRMFIFYVMVMYVDLYDVM